MAQKKDAKKKPSRHESDAGDQAPSPEASGGHGGADELEALKRERDELLEKLQRISADYANYQKRVPKQIADSIGFEKERLLKALLPVLDNFELTVQKAASADQVEAVVQGVRIIYDQMLDVLKSQGVEQITAKGQPFDPSLHEAMMRQSDPEQADQVVLEEYQKGYVFQGRTLRPSKVVVNWLEAGSAGESAATSPEPVEDGAGTKAPADSEE